MGAVSGTSWHGVFESDGFRRAFLRRVAGERGLDWVAGDEPFAARREAQLDKLGDLVAENVDRESLLRLIEGGSARDLPVVSGQLFSGQRSAVSSQQSRQAPEPPRTTATFGESTAASAQVTRSAVETKLKAES
jgi:hypothetical protein